MNYLKSITHLLRIIKHTFSFTTQRLRFIEVGYLLFNSDIQVKHRNVIWHVRAVSSFQVSSHKLNLILVCHTQGHVCFAHIC